MTISRANIEESGEIAELLVETWRYAYKDILPAEVLEKLSVKKRTKSWRKHMKSGAEAYVLKKDAAIVGVVGLSSFRDTENEYRNYSEIPVLYVLPKYIGQGLGTRLLSHVEGIAAEGGAPGLALWVLEKNQPAVDFYRKNLFVFSGQSKNYHSGLKEHLYVKAF